MELRDSDPDGAARLERVHDLVSISDEWSRLAAASGNVFASWDWSDVWWRHFGGSRTLLTYAVHDDRGGLLGILPLFEWRSFPVPVIRWLGCYGGDELGPICAPSNRDLVATALRTAIDGLGRAAFLAERMPAELGWAQRLSGLPVHREGSPVVHLGEAGWDDYLRGRSRNFREQVGRRERKLFRSESARFRLSSEPSELEADLDALFRLHTARWKGVTTNFMRLEPLHRAFARRALEKGWLRLWLLEVDGTAVAAIYGFRYGGTECYYQSGRDLAWDSHSVGFVLLAHAIREACGDGIATYKLLRGDESYKSRFATADDGLETAVLTKGITARLLLRAALAANRVGLLNQPRM
jgi:CelD/BcsL family acetyltransferase involved in cellulose biosynthesis